MRSRAVILVLAILLAGAQPARGEDLPRVVSLDYCADQFVLGLAEREQILGLSPDADKPFSHFRDRAAGLRQVRPRAEVVLGLKPDLVIRGWGGSARALDLFARHGIETVQIGYATDLDGVRGVTRTVGRALGQGARASRRIAAMPQARAPSGRSALYVTPGGVTAGAETLVGSLLAHAGLANSGGPGGWHALPLEVLALAPPDLAVTAFFGFDTDARDHWSRTRHPVMQRVLANTPRVSLSEARITCPAWFVADEAAALSRQVFAQRRDRP